MENRALCSQGIQEGKCQFQEGMPGAPERSSKTSTKYPLDLAINDIHEQSCREPFWWSGDSGIQSQGVNRNDKEESARI